MRSFLLIAAGAVALSACGGTSAVTLDDLETEADKLLDQYSDQIRFENVTDPDSLPTGSVDYSGNVGIYEREFSQTDDNYDIVGRINLTANLGDSADTISGEMYDFVSTEDEENLSGQLKLDAKYDRSSYGEATDLVTGNVSGELRGDDVVAEFDGNLGASFLGSGGEFINGIVRGNVVITEDENMGESMFGGRFIAD